MTESEAIILINRARLPNENYKRMNEAFDMAIEAIKKQESMGVVFHDNCGNETKSRRCPMEYEEIKIRVPKGKKDKIKAHADCMGESVNQYLIRLIDEDMEGLKEACNQAMDALKEVEAALKEMEK